jgi:triphosphatase
LETELKMRFLDPQDRAALLADEWFQALALPDPPEETHMQATYYDTEDGRLLARRAAFRIRLEGDRFMASIKARGKVSGGLHQRLEWSLAQEDDQPDMPAFSCSQLEESDSEGILQELVAAVGDSRLLEVCRTEFDRMTLMLGYRDTLIEAAFDSGTLVADGRSLPLEELELELKEGDVRDLVDLGRELQSRFPLVPEGKSKYARCLELKKRR